VPDFKREKNVRLRALVFDDDDGVRSLITTVLQNRGYEVEAYADPAHCPLDFHGGCPCPSEYACSDVIISDLHMPSTMGLEFLEERKSLGCKVANVAAISGAWNQKLKQQARELGIEIFDKPFKVGELIAWLETCEQKIQPSRRLTPLNQLKDSA
jgi:CheY-like chemotaxis protein